MIHQYKLGGYNIVLDICSGSVHAVDDVAYDIISIFENNDRDTIIDKIMQMSHQQTNLMRQNNEMSR